MTNPADSTPQREAQSEVLAALNRQHGWTLAAEQRVDIGPHSFVTLDGLDTSRRVAVEVNAHIGKRSASRDHKILQDAARLLLVRRVLGEPYKLVIALCDSQFHSSYARDSKKWHAEYLRLMEIDVDLVEVPPGVVEAIRSAQARQQEGNHLAGEIL